MFFTLFFVNQEGAGTKHPPPNGSECIWEGTPGRVKLIFCCKNIMSNFCNHFLLCNLKSTPLWTITLRHQILHHFCCFHTNFGLKINKIETDFCLYFYWNLSELLLYCMMGRETRPECNILSHYCHAISCWETRYSATSCASAPKQCRHWNLIQHILY